MKDSIERNAAIYCRLQIANKAMEANKIVLSNLKKLTK
jgi:hypothetical protein